MSEKKQRGLLSPVAEKPPQPLVQFMPNSRARIDPTCIPDLAAWIFVLRARWDRQSRLTYRGLKGKARELQRGKIRNARRMLVCYDDLLRSILETVDRWEFEEVRQCYTGAATPDTKE